MRNRYLILVLSLLVGTVFSCVHQPVIVDLPIDDETSAKGDDPMTVIEDEFPCDPDSAYFANDILPIFISSCAIAGCHDAETREEDLVLDSYANIMRGIRPGDPGESKFFKVMTLTETDDLMPQDPATGNGYRLPDEQLDMIRLWINQGAKDNFCTSCDTTNVTFSTDIMSIFEVSCSTSSGCHAAGSTNGVFQTYSQIKGIADNGKLNDRVLVQKDMPPGGGLTSCDIKTIQVWLEQGAPEN